MFHRYRPRVQKLFLTHTGLVVLDTPRTVTTDAALWRRRWWSFPEQVAKRFRLVPNFFVSAPDAPEIVERLWAFAAAACLDNPIPTLFKERLFVFLSRFCPVRYCIVRHCGFQFAL